MFSSALTAFIRRALWFTFTSILVLISVLPVNQASTFPCDFWDETCLDGLAQVSTRIKFEPLFPKPIELFYGYDAYPPSIRKNPKHSHNSEQYYEDTVDENDKKDLLIKLSYWLGYDRDRVLASWTPNVTNPGNWTTEVALRVGNLTAYTGGGNHGCDNVWGLTCSVGLKNYLRQSLYDLSNSKRSYESPLEAVMDQMKWTSAMVPGCPSSFFEMGYTPVRAFVQENDYNGSIVVEQPGDYLDPWKTWYLHNTTAREQAVQVAVVIISRSPSPGSAPPSSKDDIHVELACVRAPKHRTPMSVLTALVDAAEKARSILEASVEQSNESVE